MVDGVVLVGRMVMPAMEEGMEAEEEVFTRDAEGQTSMREALVERLGMDLVPAMSVSKPIMYLLMMFSGLARVDRMLVVEIEITKVTITVQTLIAILVITVISMLEDLFQITMQISWLAMGMVCMLPMSQA
jgi:hypothetical protein